MWPKINVVYIKKITSPSLLHILDPPLTPPPHVVKRKWCHQFLCLSLISTVKKLRRYSLLNIPWKKKLLHQRKETLDTCTHSFSQAHMHGVIVARPVFRWMWYMWYMVEYTLIKVLWAIGKHRKWEWEWKQKQKTGKGCQRPSYRRMGY